MRIDENTGFRLSSHRHGRHNNGGGVPGPMAQQMNGLGVAACKRGWNSPRNETSECWGCTGLSSLSSRGTTNVPAFWDRWIPPDHRPTGPEFGGSRIRTRFGHHCDRGRDAKALRQNMHTSTCNVIMTIISRDFQAPLVRIAGRSCVSGARSSKSSRLGVRSLLSGNQQRVPTMTAQADGFTSTIPTASYRLATSPLAPSGIWNPSPASDNCWCSSLVIRTATGSAWSFTSGSDVNLPSALYTSRDFTEWK